MTGVAAQPRETRTDSSMPAYPLAPCRSCLQVIRQGRRSSCVNVTSSVVRGAHPLLKRSRCMCASGHTPAVPEKRGTTGKNNGEVIQRPNTHLIGSIHRTNMAGLVPAFPPDIPLYSAGSNNFLHPATGFISSAVAQNCDQRRAVCR